MMKSLLIVLVFLPLSAAAQTAEEIYEALRTPFKYGMVVAPQSNDEKFDCPTVFRVGDEWRMTYVRYNGRDGRDGRGYETWLAASPDLLHWRTLGRVLAYPDGEAWDKNQRGGFPALIDWTWDGSYAMQPWRGKHYMTYIGGPGRGYEAVEAPLSIGLATTASDIATAHPWQCATTPLLTYNEPKAQWWEQMTQYKSTVYLDSDRRLGSRFVMFYNAGGRDATHPKGERIGIALSNDMRRWQRYAGNPVFAHDTDGTITGDAQIIRFPDRYAMVYFSAFNPTRPYKAYNTFAVSDDLVHWTDWTGPDLITPSKPYDEMFAHKSCVVKHDGVVYHFYCAVNSHDQRGIALATSRPMGKSPVAFPTPDTKARRTLTPLNTGWTTRLLQDSTGLPLTQSPQCVGQRPTSAAVTLPHNWDDYYGLRQQKHGNLHGSALYERTLTVAKQQGKRYFLQFEGVGTYATVTLNSHTYPRAAVGRTTYTLDITSHLHDGTNRLAVRCDHPALITDMPWVCGGCSSEWGFSEGSQPLGLFRPVTLVVTDAVRIEPFGVHVWNNTSRDTVFIDTEVRNYADTAATIDVVNNLNLASGKRVFRLTTTVTLKPGETQTVRQQGYVRDAKPWSVSDPYLYKVVSMVKRGGQTTDQLDTPFGLRTIEWRRTGQPGFMLNGQRTFISGTCEYEHLLGSSHAFMPEQIQSRLKAIRQAGFNAFREAHQPHNLLYQNILDRDGMLFWSQFSAHIWYDTPQFRDNFKRLLTQYVRERRNSPSLILWGLQNESVLPADFARECADIIRSLDPTCAADGCHGRLITTCNGGDGTDWNVIQNWSGTYGGTALNYDRELKRPDQLLNGEYGAWRTLGLHSEAPLDSLRKEKSYSEERATDLLETKLCLAKASADSVCGHFQWLFATHDNPGRVQPDEALRMIDKVGPANYKGLLTLWEQPTDAFFMYRANQVSGTDDPMVYIVSHTWPQRFATGARRADITAYSNCDSVLLYNSADGSVPLGRKRGTHLTWEHRLVQHNVLRAVGYVGGEAVAEDVVLLDSLAQAPGFERLYQPSTVVPTAADNNPDLLAPDTTRRYVLRLNCGGDDYRDTHGNLWRGDDLTLSRSWGGARASQTRVCVPIHGTRDWPLFQSMRYGHHRLCFDIPVKDDEYQIDLFFCEPWLGTGGGRKTDCEAQRLFSVAVNGDTLVRDLDLWAEAGHAGAVRRTVTATARGGHLLITFPDVKAGQAVISAIAVSTRDSAATPSLCDSGRPSFWAALDADRCERLPKTMLPADEEAFPAIRYTPARNQHTADRCQTAFIITPGVAREYALRFRFRNTGAPIEARLRIVDAKGTALVDRPLLFPTTPKKFKLLSTTTATQINAGRYHVQLLTPAGRTTVPGLELEWLEVQ